MSDIEAAIERTKAIVRTSMLGAQPSAAVTLVVETCESERARIERVRSLVRAADMRDIVPFTYAEFRAALDEALDPSNPAADTARELLALADDITPDRTLSEREWKLLRTAAALLDDADRDGT